MQSKEYTSKDDVLLTPKRRRCGPHKLQRSLAYSHGSVVGRERMGWLPLPRGSETCRKKRDMGNVLLSSARLSSELSDDQSNMK